MRQRALAAALLLGVCLVGCRSVWVHPQASASKYDADLYRCRYGVAKPTADAIRTGNVEPIPTRIRGDWVLCMETLDWARKRGMRWDSPYQQKR